MRNTQKTLMLVLLAGAVLLGACGGSASNTDAILTEAAQIAFQALTETAAAAPPTATFTPVPPTPTFTAEPPTATATLEGGVTPTPFPTQAQQQQPSTSGIPCLRANLEWESHPDGVQIYADIPFTKVWRLKNTGSCTWDREFAAIWVQGDLMGAETVVEFTENEIAPGDYAMVEVSMRAPDRSGFYKGYWMLRGDGVIFGIGNNARSWFWVDIEVLPVTEED